MKKNYFKIVVKMISFGEIAKVGNLLVDNVFLAKKKLKEKKM